MAVRAKNLGQFLKNRRKAVGLSQREIAKSLKVNSQFISNWERGLCKPPDYFLKPLSHLLEIPKEDFLDFLCKESGRYWKDMLEL